jgi:hypothetical protein
LGIKKQITRLRQKLRRGKEKPRFAYGGRSFGLGDFFHAMWPFFYGIRQKKRLPDV